MNNQAFFIALNRVGNPIAEYWIGKFQKDLMR